MVVGLLVSFEIYAYKGFLFFDSENSTIVIEEENDIANIHCFFLVIDIFKDYGYM